jgi:hypothetical protein
MSVDRGVFRPPKLWGERGVRQGVGSVGWITRTGACLWGLGWSTKMCGSSPCPLAVGSTIATTGTHSRKPKQGEQLAPLFLKVQVSNLFGRGAARIPRDRGTLGLERSSLRPRFHVSFTKPAWNKRLDRPRSGGRVLVASTSGVSFVKSADMENLQKMDPTLTLRRFASDAQRYENLPLHS